MSEYFACFCAKEDSQRLRTFLRSRNLIARALKEKNFWKKTLRKVTMYNISSEICSRK